MTVNYGRIEATQSRMDTVARRTTMSLEILDVGQANELKLAFRRNGFNNEQVKQLCEGNILAQVLSVLNGVMEIVPRKFPTWRRITIGLHKTVAELRKALEDGGFQISEYTGRVFAGMKLAEVVTELELVIVSVAELGFLNGATFEQIVKRAKELGLELCLVEAGTALRLAYKDQPNGEWLWIAMEPVADAGGRLSVLRVVRDDGGLWLGTRWFDPQYVWRPASRLVFCRK